MRGKDLSSSRLMRFPRLNEGRWVCLAHTTIMLSCFSVLNRNDQVLIANLPNLAARGSRFRSAQSHNLLRHSLRQRLFVRWATQPEKRQEVRSDMGHPGPWSYLSLPFDIAQVSHRKCLLFRCHRSTGECVMPQARANRYRGELIRLVRVINELVAGLPRSREFLHGSNRTVRQT